MQTNSVATHPAAALVLECEAALTDAEQAGRPTKYAEARVASAYEAAYACGLTDADILGELRDTATSL